MFVRQLVESRDVEGGETFAGCPRIPVEICHGTNKRVGFLNRDILSPANTIAVLVHFQT